MDNPTTNTPREATTAILRSLVKTCNFGKLVHEIEKQADIRPGIVSPEQSLTHPSVSLPHVGTQESSKTCSQSQRHSAWIVNDQWGIWRIKRLSDFRQYTQLNLLEEICKERQEELNAMNSQALRPLRHIEHAVTVCRNVDRGERNELTIPQSVSPGH